MKNKFIEIFVIMLVFATSFSVTAEIEKNDKNKTNFDDLDNWPMLCHDPTHTSYSTSNAPDTNETLFTRNIDGFVDDGITVSDGYVYVGTFNGNIYCINAYTGSIEYQLSGYNTIYSSITVNEDRLYFSRFHKYTYCLDLSNGNQIWEHFTDGFTVSSPIVVGDKVYIGNFEKLLCLDAEGNGNGTTNEIWTYPGVSIYNTPAIHDNKIFFVSSSEVYCLNAENGNYTWDTTISGGQSSGSISISENKLYVPTSNGDIYCLNAENGTIEWQTPIGGSSASSPAISNNLIYIGSKDNKLYCLYANNGTIKWEKPTLDTVLSSPAVADGKVFFGDSSGLFYCLDSENGDEIWTYEIEDNSIKSSIAIFSGKVYAATGENNQNNKLFSFGTNSPPETPNQPVGDTNGFTTIEYNYTTDEVSDPDGDMVEYLFDWGDGSNSGWIDNPSSSHSWNEAGSYEVKVKARDIPLGEQSDFSDPLEVIVEEFPESEIIIKSIEGGIGITAVIENIGNAEATDIEWTITIEGGFFILTKEATDIIGNIDAGEEQEITMPVLGIGLGIITDVPVITVSAECAEGSSDSDSVEAKILLSKVIIQ